MFHQHSNALLASIRVIQELMVCTGSPEYDFQESLTCDSVSQTVFLDGPAKTSSEVSSWLLRTVLVNVTFFFVKIKME